jgi:CheY-like chemotaxis protein
MTTVGQEILVLDDEAPMRGFVGMNHAARGYQVLVAADGAEALEQVAIGHPAHRAHGWSHLKQGPQKFVPEAART